MTTPSRQRLWMLAGLLALLTVLLVLRSRNAPRPGANVAPEDALAALVRFEEEQAQAHWGPELRARQFGQAIDGLWDRINAGTNKLAVLASLEFELQLPRFANLVHLDLPHGIRVLSPSGGAWPELIARHSAAGWELVQCEFRQIAFHTNQPGRATASGYWISGHLRNDRTTERAIIEGNVLVWWNERPDLPPIREVDARQLQVRLRGGPPAFERVVNDTIAPPPGSYFIDPLLLWDFDGDGLSEIVLAAKNAIYRRTVDGAWTASTFLEHDPGLIFTALLGDFDGDGWTDFICAKFDGLFLHSGTADGQFPHPPRLVWPAQPRLRYAQTLTAGDVDGDGDLDLFLGQYKVPYDQGQMPFPYFDANDGHPSFLLLNNGQGQFVDGTVAAGLGAKRGRRAYSSSLVDLDRDGDLDLVVISDFAGLDVYENQGDGRFADITRRFGETYGFGMAHVLADIDRNGAVDLWMIAMNSPTADRLAALHLNRPYDANDAEMRTRITYGNRLFLGAAGGGFKQTPLSDFIARTGWSWGAVAQDFDNDGFPDLYVANGHETRQSVQEYEPEFWLHDIYVGNSRENSLAQAYFQQKHSRTRGRGHSYGGYEKNRFFLNLGGTNFVEVAHLLGLALEHDSRNVAADDLNGDGKMDLIVTTFEAWPVPRQTLQIFENRLPDAGHWVSHNFKPEPGVYGAQLWSGQSAHALVAGDSYRVQHPLKVHLGLGATTNLPAFILQPVSRPAVQIPPGSANQRLEFDGGGRANRLSR